MNTVLEDGAQPQPERMRPAREASAARRERLGGRSAPAGTHLRRRWAIAVPLLASAVLAGSATAQSTGAWTTVQSMGTGRYAPGIVRMADNNILVAGGYHNAPYETAGAQIFNPLPRTWAATGSLQRARNFPVGVLVDENRDGKDETAIFFGGYSSYYGTLNTAERYTPATKSFAYLTYTLNRKTYSSVMTSPRELFTATKLPSGKLLLTAGLRTGYGTLRSAEIYDPVTRRFTATGSLVDTLLDSDAANDDPLDRYGRFGHDAMLLPDGKNVLVAGGKAWVPGQPWPSLATAQIYNIATGKFTKVPYRMNYARDRVTMAQVGGRILLVGGTDDQPSYRKDPLETEWFDPSTMVDTNGVITFTGSPFSVGPSLQQGRMAHTLTPLPDGGFLVTGGWSMERSETVNNLAMTEKGTTAITERYLPTSNSFVTVGSTKYDALDPGAAQLWKSDATGSTFLGVLVIGGKQCPEGDAYYLYPPRAEIYTP